jgi:peptide methionine sulfoxide reductase MsrB
MMMQFDSHCGWPSFFLPADGKLGGKDGAKVAEHADRTLGMDRIEVRPFFRCCLIQAL